MEKVRNIVVVLRSGGDFTFKDVELISYHIYHKWKSEVKPNIICLYDKATKEYDLGYLKVIPLVTEFKGTWSRIVLYSEEMEKYKPFLYVDLDTAIISSLENIIALVTDESKFITLADFWQPGKLATGLVWFPKDCKKTKHVYEQFKGPTGARMDLFLRSCLKVDAFWQDLTDTIYDFKKQSRELLQVVPENADLICFHGKPRIFEASIRWVREYINWDHMLHKVTVIIPYKEDRGWLKDAMNSVPIGVQFILSKGDGNWPSNFNKVLSRATGKYIKYLHEDDMLTEDSILTSIKAIEEQNVDFIHGNAYELYQNSGKFVEWKPSVEIPTIKTLLQKNTIHSATTMYRREIFDKLGGFNQSDDVHSFEELEFNLRVLKAGFKIGYCDSFLAIYRRHNKQIIRTVDKNRRSLNRKNLISKYM